eukprot:gene13539-20205_t
MPKWHECDYTDAIALFRAAGGSSGGRLSSWRKVYTFAVDPSGRKLESVTPVVTDPCSVWQSMGMPPFPTATLFLMIILRWSRVVNPTLTVTQW